MGMLCIWAIWTQTGWDWKCLIFTKLLPLPLAPSFVTPQPGKSSGEWLPQEMWEGGAQMMFTPALEAPSRGLATPAACATVTAISSAVRRGQPIFWSGGMPTMFVSCSTANHPRVYVPFIDKYGTIADTRLLTATGCLTNNGTKANPCLSADILGDWREEVIFRTSDNTALRIYTTTTPATNRIYTLMHDPQYRLSIAWQNVVYNQPPHVGFYLGDGMAEPPRPQIIVPQPRLYGDFTGDNKVDMNDLSYFTGFWLENDCNETAELDLNGDCIINFYEFSVLAENWLIADTTAPLAPTGLSATAWDATVSLDWNDNGESDLDGYNIYRSTTSGSGYSRLNGSLLSSSNYTDNSVTNGTTYYYVVTAVDKSSNESNYSSEVSATPNEISSITIQEYTTGFCDVDGTVDNANAGFTGTGYANTDNATGTGINWRINIQSSGTYIFTWRFANGTTSNRPARLLVNGSTVVSTINFPSTGNWTTWSEVSVNVTLSTGIKDIRLEATGINGLANIDYLMVTGAGPQAASCL